AGTTGLNLISSSTGSTWFDLSNTSTGGKQWNLISTGSSASEGAGKLLLRSNEDSRVVMTLQGTGEVGIGTPTPATPLDLAIGTYRVQFRDEGGTTPGLNLGGTGGGWVARPARPRGHGRPLHPHDPRAQVRARVARHGDPPSRLRGDAPHPRRGGQACGRGRHALVPGVLPSGRAHV